MMMYSETTRLTRPALGFCLAWLVLLNCPAAFGQTLPQGANLQRENLVAWCIVPFDSKQRGPEERAQMLAEIGMTRLAYDWREEHVATWDREVDALAKNKVELTAFWCSTSLQPTTHASTQRIVRFLKRREIATQIWIMLPERQLMEIADEASRIQTAARAVAELADQVEPLNCQVGLYNHGGWIGKPATLVRVMQALDGHDNVGIVYNFHHAHEDLGAFPEALVAMKPFLLCLNLNGMDREGPKIQSIGQGALDEEILGWIKTADYRGLVGVLDHRNDRDAKESLLENLEGLEKLTSASEK